MTIGDIREVVAIAKTQGKESLLKIRFRVFRLVRLMLAQMANNIAEALKNMTVKQLSNTSWMEPEFKFINTTVM